MNALARALPLALCLPMPGLVPRVALGLVLAFAAPAIDQSLWHEAFVGVALGLSIALPVLAARQAGLLIDVTLQRRGTMASIYTALAWVIFGAAGGFETLMRAHLASYTTPHLELPLRLFALTASFALPTLLALAIVELGAALLQRYEESAGFEVGALQVARSARPLVATLLLVASLAALSHGLAEATRVLR